MKDFLGKELAVGDRVIFIEPGYRNFWTGKILRFTPKMVIVSYKNSQNGELKQTSDQLVKV